MLLISKLLTVVYNSIIVHDTALHQLLLVVKQLMLATQQLPEKLIVCCET